MRTVNPMLNYYDWPRVDALRMVRGASQFGAFDAVSFKNAITQVMTDNGICDEAPTASVDTSNGSEVTVTIGYAKTIASVLPNDTELLSLIRDAVQSGASKVTLPKKYKGILKELKG